MKFENLRIKRNCIKSVTCQISVILIISYLASAIFLDSIMLIKSTFTSNEILFLTFIYLYYQNAMNWIDIFIYIYVLLI